MIEGEEDGERRGFGGNLTMAALSQKVQLHRASYPKVHCFCNREEHVRGD